ncbi:MAG TPA: MGMT family protein [Patescibacteria group bacterium]
MRDYAKTGGKRGLPGYRTPSMFRSKVLKIVMGIPKGKMLTYKQVAQKAGNSKAYRAVGNILNKNCDPNVPCHRVIRSDGKLGGYNKGVERKALILRKEGAI